MAKPRVHEVAKELGLTSKEVLAHLEKIGQPAKSHSSSIEESLADRVRSELSNGSKTEKKAAPKTTEAKTTQAKPTKPAAKKPAAKKPEPPKRAAEAPASKPPAKPSPEKTAPVEVRPEPAPEATAAADEISVHRGITVQDFAAKVDRAPNEIVKVLLGLGEMMTVNQSMSDEAVLLWLMIFKPGWP